MTDDAPDADGRPVPNEPLEPVPDDAGAPVHRIAEARNRPRRAPNHQNSPAARKPPPSDLTAEESLLGAMLLSRDAISVAGQICSASDFYKPAYGHVFQAIVDLDNGGQAADPVTVADHLRRHDLLDAIGGPAVLTDLQGNTPATSNAAQYARIVAEHALLRSMIGAAGEIAELGYSVPADVPGAVDHAEQLLFAVTDPRRASTAITMRASLSAVLDNIQDRIERDDQLPGITTGFHDLDRLTYGHEPRQLIVIGARPSMGKTGLAGALAVNAAKSGHPTLIFSAEMSHEELTERFVASESGVDLDRLKRGEIADRDWPHISAAVGRLNELPIETNDDPAVTLMTIRAVTRRFHRTWGRVGLVIVDYLQLMTPLQRSENRNVEVSELSRGLKVFAGEIHAPVIALSQLSRNLEQRRDKRPVLSDLRDSGAVEQDADKVLLLYRDEIYNPKSEDRGVMEVHVAKHRGGPTGVARLAYMPQRSQFHNLAQT